MKRIMIGSRRGYSRVDVLVIVTIVCLIGALAPVLLGQQKDDGGAARGFRMHRSTTKDAAQVRGIHQAWLVFSREMNGVLPTPGLVNRLAADGGQQIPGRGAEDKNANTTANLYSVCIMMNYFTPEFAVSPVERSPKVKVASNFNYEQYNPVNDVYWDTKFVADLEKGSNVSYAHEPIAGERVKEWRDTANPQWPVVGNRGPKGGQPNPNSYTCGPHGNWAGNIVFNDNHVEFLQSVPGTADENIFAPETKGALITFTKEFANGEPMFQFD